MLKYDPNSENFGLGKKGGIRLGEVDNKLRLPHSESLQIIVTAKDVIHS